MFAAVEDLSVIYVAFLLRKTFVLIFSTGADF